MARKVWTITVDRNTMLRDDREAYRRQMEPHCEVEFLPRPQTNLLDIVHSSFWYPEDAYDVIQTMLASLKIRGVDVIFTNEEVR